MTKKTANPKREIGEEEIDYLLTKMFLRVPESSNEDEDDDDDPWIRQTALELAVRAVVGRATNSTIIETARLFAGYLRGDLD